MAKNIIAPISVNILGCLFYTTIAEIVVTGLFSFVNPMVVEWQPSEPVYEFPSLCV
jgi:hypothetical protein